MIAPQRQRGFSLLELLLVIMLLAILLASAYGGINAAVRGMRAGEAVIERVDKIRTVQEFLRHQLSRTLPFPFAQRDTQLEVFDGGANYMRFVAPMPGYLSHGGSYVQTLQLSDGDDGQQLVFTSTLLNGFSADKANSDATSTVVLLDHIREGKFSFRGLDKQNNLMNWSDNWEDSTTTPLMVGIELSLDGGQIQFPAMAIPLMMDATAGGKFSKVWFGK